MSLSKEEKNSQKNFRMYEIMTNAITTLRSVFSSRHGVSKDGARDLYDVYGYKRNRSFKDFFDMYDQEGIASRVVKAVARSCWRDGVGFVKDEKPIYEDEIKLLIRLGLFKQFEKADILNRIGKYSIFYIGIPGQDPTTPLTKSTGKIEDVFFTPYAQDGTVITKWNQDATNKRFGMPEMYSLQVMNRGEKETDILTMERKVHWSRVVHLAEDALDSGIEGSSCLQAIFNDLEDIDKITGGAAEAYYRNARGKYALEAMPEFKGTLEQSVKDDLEEEISAFTNNWRDVIRLAGMTAKTLNTPHADPTGSFKASMAKISGATGIPIRILLGEGAGQLAGNEDKESYNQLIADRQKQWCSTWLFEVLDILSLAGMFPEVEDGVEAKWPVSDVLNEKGKAEVKRITGDALRFCSKALEPGSSFVGEISPQQIIEEIFHLKYKPVPLTEQQQAAQESAFAAAKVQPGEGDIDGGNT